jgi:hypothetical protein
MRVVEEVMYLRHSDGMSVMSNTRGNRRRAINGDVDECVCSANPHPDYISSIIAQDFRILNPCSPLLHVILCELE